MAFLQTSRITLRPLALRSGTRSSSLYLTSSTSRKAFTTTQSTYAQKGAEDRESLKPRSTEYSQSGGGDDAANEATDAAFNPSKTSPETAEKSAGQDGGSGANPLNASPANQDLNQAKGGEKAENTDRKRSQSSV